MDRPDERMMQNLQTATTSSAHPIAGGARNAIDRGIRAFLNGETHGENVLGALYGTAADEPIPERLRAVLKV